MVASQTNQNQKQLKTLAIDYGERYLGLAVETIAGPMPLEPIDIKKSNWNERILSVVKSHHVEEIVLGISGGNKELEKKVKTFKRALENLTKLEVKLVDETMTSQWAEKKMTEAEAKKKNIKEKSHSLAAYKILKGYKESSRALGKVPEIDQDGIPI